MLLEDEQDSSGVGEFFSLFTSFTSRISHLLTCGEGKYLASEEEDFLSLGINITDYRKSL